MNLFKALSYKEWIKTRRMLGILSLLGLAVLAYSFIEVTHLIRIKNAVNVWYAYLFMGYQLNWSLFAFPILAGLTTGLVQYLPEMTNRRLKLTLHLPASETSIVSSMLLYGYGMLGLLFLVFALLLSLSLSFIFSGEIIRLVLSQLIPALVAGLCTYGFTAWVCMEPQWRQRICNLLVSAGLLSVFFLAESYLVYSHFVPCMLLLLAGSFFFPFLSATRFKQGVL